MKGFHPPTQNHATSKNYKVTEEYKKMFRKTIPLSLLAAAALVSTFLPAAQANQIEVNKQNAVQNAAAVGTGNYVGQELNQTSLQNQTTAPRSSGYYHIPQSGTPQIQISGQEGIQNGAAVGTGNYVGQELNQTSLQNQKTTAPTSSSYYRIPQAGTPQIQISGQEGVQNGASIGIGNYVDQELNQNSLQREVKF